MKFITDDHKHTFDTFDECQAFEEAQKAFEEAQRIDGVLVEQIGEYLDSIKVKTIDPDTAQEVERNLMPREFVRRENVIKDWIRWDRRHRPERYAPQPKTYEYGPVNGPVKEILT